MEESSRHRPKTDRKKERERERAREYDKQLFLLFSFLAAIAEYVCTSRRPSSFSWFLLYMMLCACPFTAAVVLWHIMREKKKKESSFFSFFHQSIGLMLVDNDDVTPAEKQNNSQEKTTTKMTSIPYELNSGSVTE
jgi:hypothetical protein